MTDMKKEKGRECWGRAEEEQEGGEDKDKVIKQITSFIFNLEPMDTNSSMGKTFSLHEPRQVLFLKLHTVL